MKKVKLSNELLWDYILSPDFKFIFLYFVIMISMLIHDQLVAGRFFNFMRSSLTTFGVIGVTIGVSLLYETSKIYFSMYNNEAYLLRYEKRSDILKEIIMTSIKVGLTILIQYILAIIFVNILKGNYLFENYVERNFYGWRVLDSITILIIRLIMFVINIQCLSVLLFQSLKRKEIAILIIVLLYPLIRFTFFFENNTFMNFFIPSLHIDGFGLSKSILGNIGLDFIYHFSIFVIILICIFKKSNKRKII